MEKSTLIGVGSGLVLIYGAIFMGDGWMMFFDVAALILVLGGTVAALLVNFSLADLSLMPKGFKDFLKFQAPNPEKFLETFTEFSRVARREGLLALDRRLDENADEYVRFGLEMAVDGIEEAEIDDLMKIRMSEEATTRGLAAKFFGNSALYAPAFGMIGTLIGLIQMMQSLDDPSQIGKGMAVALITTFYGALLANLIFLPIAAKMKMQNAQLLRSRQMVRIGVLAIVRGESPSLVEKRLKSFVGGDVAAAAAEEPAALSRAA